MTIDTIVESTKGCVKIIRFKKPHLKNAIDKEMYLRMIEILNDAATNDDITIVVLTGTGDVFSSGNDMKAGKDFLPLIPTVKELVDVFITFPKILVAIVNGPAVGVAVSILTFCDYVYASERAFFRTPFIKVNLFVEACTSYNLPRLMVSRKAMELVTMDKKMSAKEALACGFVTDVWKPELLYDRAWERIKELSQLPPYNLLMTKKLIARPHIEKLKEANEIEAQEVVKLLSKSKL